MDYKPTIRGRDEVTETARSVEELRQRSIKALQLDLVKKLSEGLKEKNAELEQLVEQLQRSQEQIIMRRKLVELGQLTAESRTRSAIREFHEELLGGFRGPAQRA